MKSSIRDLLLVTVIVALGVGCAPTLPGGVAAIVLGNDDVVEPIAVGTLEYEAREGKMKFKTDKAHGVAVAVDKGLGGSPGLCKPVWIVGDDYVFMRFPEKLGLPLFGIYVNGQTGKGRYVTRDEVTKRFHEKYPGAVIDGMELERIRARNNRRVEK